MVALAIAIMRGYTTKETLENAFKMERIDIPIAPGLNLLLEEVLLLELHTDWTYSYSCSLQPHYDSYNRRYGKDGLHEPLLWDAHKDEIEKFVAEHIMPVIYKGETEENSMMNWLTTLQRHTYSVREDVPQRSVPLIGEAAVAAAALSDGGIPQDQNDPTPSDEIDSD